MIEGMQYSMWVLFCFNFVGRSLALEYHLHPALSLKLS
jgi:hypothetical protein